MNVVVILVFLWAPAEHIFDLQVVLAHGCAYVQSFAHVCSLKSQSLYAAARTPSTGHRTVLHFLACTALPFTCLTWMSSARTSARCSGLCANSRSASVAACGQPPDSAPFHDIRSVQCEQLASILFMTESCARTSARCSGLCAVSRSASVAARVGSLQHRPSKPSASKVAYI